MNILPDSRHHSSKGAALMIVLAFVVLLTGLALAYFSRTTTDRQLAQSSFNDTTADLLARSALDIVVSDFKQEIAGLPANCDSRQHSAYNLWYADKPRYPKSEQTQFFGRSDRPHFEHKFYCCVSQWSLGRS
jgi:hypothetical protein